MVLFPFTIGFYIVIHILPALGIFHPVFYLLYPLAALTIFYSMLQFRLLESAPRVQFVLPFLLFFIILLAVFYISTVNRSNPRLQRTRPWKNNWQHSPKKSPRIWNRKNSGNTLATSAIRRSNITAAPL